MIQTLADLEKLKRTYPAPNLSKINRHMAKIERMVSFYRDKSLNAPKAQQVQFNEFVSALTFSHEIVRSHYGVMTKLEKLIEEYSHENRPDSSK